MSQILRTLYASHPAGQFSLLALELVHASFPNGRYRFVLAHKDYDLGEGGQTHTFQSTGMRLQRPQRGTKERPSLKFQLDNVTLQVSEAIDGAIEAGGHITCIFREYSSTDLSEPQKTAPNLVATAASGDRHSVAISASFRDNVNRGWPFRRYTAEKFPGLKYL